jgi:hypothetical protein
MGCVIGRTSLQWRKAISPASPVVVREQLAAIGPKPGIAHLRLGA